MIQASPSRASFIKKCAVSLVAAGLVAGNASMPAAAQSAAPLTSIKIATPGNDGNAMAWYAQDSGIFAKHGLTAEITPIRRGGGAAIAAAIAGGAADIGEGDIVAVATARARGIPITMLAPSFLYRSSNPVQALVVAKTSTIKTAKDLDGKTIGVISLEGPAKVATQKYLVANGADISTIKFIEITPSTAAAEVARGQIASATVNEPNLTPALETTRELAYPFNSLGNQVQVSAWFAKEDWVKANPVAARAFVDAMKDTAIWANNVANQPMTAIILQKYDRFPTDFIKKMRRASYGEKFDLTTMQPLLDAAFDQKSISAHVDARTLLNPYALVKK